MYQKFKNFSRDVVLVNEGYFQTNVLITGNDRMSYKLHIDYDKSISVAVTIYVHDFIIIKIG